MAPKENSNLSDDDLSQMGKDIKDAVEGERFDQTVDDEIQPSVKIAEEVEISLEDQLKDLGDRNLRLQAEMENVRHRAAREVQEARQFSTLPLLKDLLEVVDNVERAIEAAEKSEESESLLAGFRLVAQLLQTTLEKHHCKQILTAGEAFDPNYHEAIQQMPSEEHPEGHVALVTQSGYKLHERVVRPSQVIVSTGPAS